MSLAENFPEQEIFFRFLRLYHFKYGIDTEDLKLNSKPKNDNLDSGKLKSLGRNALQSNHMFDM